MGLVLSALIVSMLVSIGSSGPAQASVVNDATAAVIHANQAGYRSSIGVMDTQTGDFWGAGDYDQTYASESVVKVFIATRLLLTGQMTGWNATTAWTMITQSDDASADALYGRVGGDALIDWIKTVYGLPNLGSRPPRAGWWGGTQITAHGLAQFYDDIRHDPNVWNWLGNAMHNATVNGSDGTYQYFGIPSATSGAAIKQGWGEDDTAGQPAFNSTGLVNGDRYAVVILTQGPGYGAPISNMVTAEAQLLMPGGLIDNDTPVGSLDSVTRQGRSTFTLSGWAFDPTAPTATTRVDVYVGSSGSSTSADLPRPDVAAAYGISDANHGFAISVTAPEGTSQICAYAIAVDTTVNRLLSCTTVTVGISIGNLDVLSAGTALQLSGWAFAPSDPGVPTRVDVYVGQKGYSTIASGSRPDVAAAYGLSSATHGFSLRIPMPLGSQQVCAYAIGSNTSLNTLLGCEVVTGPLLPVGSIDSVGIVNHSATVAGWAFDPVDGSQPIRVDVYVGSSGASTVAALARPDVAAVYALASAAHGFTITVPLQPGANQICEYAIALNPTQNSLLGCQAANG